jgi:rhodanese-related sulfurtransferase
MVKLKSSKQLVEEAMANIKTIEPSELRLLLEKNSHHILIDIRDIRELKKTGKITGSKHIPRGMLEFWLDPESPYFKKINPETLKILYCASGWRSALATKSLKDMGFENVFNVKGGFENLVNNKFSIEDV